MKKTLFLLTVLLVSVATFSQERKYQKSMEKGIAMLGEASTTEDYLSCEANFEKTAARFDNRWIPSYYAAYSLILASLQDQDGPRDGYLESAQGFLDNAFAMDPNESEIMLLSAFHTLAKIAVDPESRGPEYFEDFNFRLEKAKALNPNNPRCYYLQGLLTLNMPDFMGGGPEAAKPVFVRATEKFKAFQHPDPFWPRWGEDLTMDELERL